MATANGLVICSNGCQAIVDSGTTLVVGPTSEINQLNEKLGFSSVDGSIDCTQVDKMPNVHFVINKNTLSLSPQDYTRKVNA